MQEAKTCDNFGGVMIVRDFRGELFDSPLMSLM